MASIFERWRLVSKPSIVNVTVSGDASTQVLNMTATELYRTQDNLRAVIDFLSNSIAQLPLKVYVRNDEDERKRDRTSDAALLLWRPNDYMTQFEFIRGLVEEYFVYGAVYVWIVPSTKSASGWDIHIIPTNWVIGSETATPYKPGTIRVYSRSGGEAVDIPEDEFIQFKTYSPGHPGGYLSPISALRQTLLEQVEAGRFRRQLWRSSGRLNAQIIRPKDVAPWTDEQRIKFAEAFRMAWGAGGSKAGSIPLMEDGMEIKPFQTSFKESEWAQSVVLSRESVAAAYGINPSLIWHSNTQTYASSKDNARALYAECLGPVIQMLQQRINAFLLPKIGADPNTYVEFDIEEKLKWSFEERASILQSAVGGPWLTRDEARAELNLPALPDGQGAQIITPLNVVTGAVAAPNDTPGGTYNYPAVGGDQTDKSAEPCGCKQCKTTEELRLKGKSTEEEDKSIEEILTAFFERQKRSVLPKINSGDPDFWNEERWDKELAEDLQPALEKIADKHGEEAAETLGSFYVVEVTRKYIEKTAQARAKNINKRTLQHIQKNLEEDEPDPAQVFETRSNESNRMARAAAGAIASWALIEAAHQAISSGAPRTTGKIIEKEWVTGPNSRPSHAAMNGERVPIDADFSNGQHWPGEDIGDPDESCGCNCTTEVIIGG